MQIRRIAAKRGYLAIGIRDRGPIGRGLKAGFRAASKKSWYRTTLHFHAKMRDKRFDPAHQKAAGFAMRKGEGLAKGSKAYERSYTGIKEAKFGHTRALERTGDTRKAVRTANISSTSNGGKASYPGASTFSYRHPRSRIRMQDEFRRILPSEAEELAGVYDAGLDQEWKPE
jgi:hypothetical protein